MKLTIIFFRRAKTICLFLIAANCLFVSAQTRPPKNIEKNQTIASRFVSGDSALKIPLDIDNNIIRIEVSVNHSKPLKFIFDTGASISVIGSRQAAELGLKPQGKVHGDATGGKISGSYTKGVSLGVQNAEVSNLMLAAIAFNTPPGFEFDGVIGCDFINQFVVEIDYPNRIMNLYDPQKFTYNGKGEIIPLLLKPRKTPLVRTKIILEGRAAPVVADLEVDTGADDALTINSPFVRKHKLTQAITIMNRSKSYGAGSGEQKLLVGRVKAIRLGNLIINNPAIGLSQDTEGAGASKENDGLIGGEIFRRFKVILDYSRKQMILEPNERFNDPYDVETDSILSSRESFNKNKIARNTKQMQPLSLITSDRYKLL